MVDFVVIDDNPKPLETIKYLKPDFLQRFEYSDDLPKKLEKRNHR